MRLLIDMNLTPRWVAWLEASGHDAVHWSMVGPIRATDASICEYAREHGFVVVTNDLDYPQLLAHTEERAVELLQATTDLGVDGGLVCSSCVASRRSSASSGVETPIACIWHCILFLWICPGS